jgi:hypothetical protein
VKLQAVVGQQIIPAVRNLWEFYEVLTTGKVGTCTPGATHLDAGKSLDVHLNAIESSGEAVAARLLLLETGGATLPPPGSTSVVSLLQRILQLEHSLASGGVATGTGTGEFHGGVPDLFGVRAPAWEGRRADPTPSVMPVMDDPRLGQLEAKL